MSKEIYLTMDISILYILLFYGRLPVKSENKSPIIASTSKIWIRLPTASPKPMNPTSHPTIKTTIIMLIIPLIVYNLMGYLKILKQINLYP